jgi:hypothetical protein
MSETIQSFRDSSLAEKDRQIATIKAENVDLRGDLDAVRIDAQKWHDILRNGLRFTDGYPGPERVAYYWCGPDGPPPCGWSVRDGLFAALTAENKQLKLDCHITGVNYNSAMAAEARAEAANATLKAAIGTPEVYAGVITRVVEDELGALRVRVKKLEEAVQEALSQAEAEWATVRNHPGSSLAADVAYYRDALTVQDGMNAAAAQEKGASDSMSEELELYGLDGWEHLETDVDAVVERAIDDACEKAGESFGTIAARITWPLRIGVYHRMTLPEPERLATQILDNLLDYLDEDYGDPEGNHISKSTPAMQEAALACAKVVRECYVSWACEPTGKVITVTQEEARAMCGDEGPVAP